MNRLDGHMTRIEWKNITLTGSIIAILFWIFLSLEMAMAASTSEDEKFTWPSFARSTPLKKEFTAVKHYNFTIRNFSPAVVVEQLAEPILFEELLFPEQVVRSHISAMRAGDYDWWLSTMDEQLREMMKTADIEKDFVEKRKAQWVALLQDTNVTMEQWIETGRYLIITVRLHSEDNPQIPKEGLEIPIVMSVREGTWLVTARLKIDDPVYQNFNSPELVEKDSIVIERTIR